ncbi:hypothetical protein BB560_003018 [Smittium megazygosporum]|uniref:Uncharacterized protein n=1 Tax=Smittium megazygosporum TaxID=133381 RepID=A0A2T9ZD71_9FUNG|nr:hypothetical protein BB560_003018 [Smittium megazygosporum]
MLTDCGFVFEPVNNKTRLRSFSKIQEKFKLKAEKSTSTKPKTEIKAERPKDATSSLPFVLKSINSEPLSSDGQIAANLPPKEPSPDPPTIIPPNEQTKTEESQVLQAALEKELHSSITPVLESIERESPHFQKAQKAIAQREFFANIKTEETAGTDKISKLVFNPSEKRKSVSETELKIIKRLKAANRKKNKTINPNQLVKASKSHAPPRRRSTFGVRGKRASGIGNGYTASPHEEIETRLLYRHISPEMPEPLRLRQLLAWCVQRNSTPKIPSELASNKGISSLAEKVITILFCFPLLIALKEVFIELKAAIESGVLTTSWYNRPKTEAEAGANDANEKKMQHPQNIANEKQRIQLIEQIVTLQEEIRKLEKVKSESKYIIKDISNSVTSVFTKLHDFEPSNDALLGIQPIPEQNNNGLSNTSRDELLSDWDSENEKFQQACEFNINLEYQHLFKNKTTAELIKTIGEETGITIDDLEMKANNIQSQILSSVDLFNYANKVISSTTDSRNLNKITKNFDQRTLLLDLSDSLSKVTL